MGIRKKLGSFLKKVFKTSELKTTSKMAVSRLSVFKNQRQVRCSIARSDVVEFLNLGNHERALIRVDQVIKEQNMLDVYVLLEGYCHLMIERVNLFEHEKVCPEELNEAVSTLIYASSRCGDFPELQKIRAIFTSRYGKEFVARAVELRNNCGVNINIIQKLYTKMPSLETKMKVLKEIAMDSDIVLQIGETILDSTLEHEDSINVKSPQNTSVRVRDDFFDSPKIITKYRDVTHAAQTAFESAAYAAAAARAAVELSRTVSKDQDDLRPRKLLAKFKTTKFDHTQNSDSELKEESLSNNDIKVEKSKENVSETDSSSNSGDENMIKGMQMLSADENDDFRARIVEPLNLNRRPISVRTRWVNGP